MFSSNCETSPLKTQVRVHMEAYTHSLLGPSCSTFLASFFLLLLVTDGQKSVRQTDKRKWKSEEKNTVCGDGMAVC